MVHMYCRPRWILLGLGLLLLMPLAAVGDGSKLAPGDVVMVAVDGEKEFSKPYQINGEGAISLPMVDQVSVLGLNTTDAAAVITKALTKVLVNPQVTVSFVERAKMQVFVVGQVKKPGLVEVGVGDRVLQALAQAGYDDTADLSRVNVRRGDRIIDVDLTKYLASEDLTVNMELQSGDTVVVPRADMIGSVLILGQVNRVGSVGIKTGMTFREVMGLIGGVTVEADTEKITLRRQGVTEPLRIDYTRAMDGDPSADLVLQPGDTIYVAQTETAFFTVMGAVNRPAQYPLKGRLSLSEAIGLAGGPVPNVGDLKKVQVVRAAGEKPKGETLNINLVQLMASAEPEPVVQRGDVIVVGSRKQRASFWEIIRSVAPFLWVFL